MADCKVESVVLLKVGSVSEELEQEKHDLEEHLARLTRKSTTIGINKVIEFCGANQEINHGVLQDVYERNQLAIQEVKVEIKVGTNDKFQRVEFKVDEMMKALNVVTESRADISSGSSNSTTSGHVTGTVADARTWGEVGSSRSSPTRPPSAADVA